MTTTTTNEMTLVSGFPQKKKMEAAEHTAAPKETCGIPFVDAPRMTARNVSVSYEAGAKSAIRNINLDIGEKQVLAMIGPSGCGKSTFLRCLNRMNDTVPGCEVTGEILLDGHNIYAKEQEIVELRSQVGMVFQRPNPFPKSIYDNVAYGPRIHGLVDHKDELDEVIEESLRRAGLWEEVKSRLDQPATGLSGGQQQRLCIARSIAIAPEVILMDEPCSALDPIATGIIEDLIEELKENFSIVMVTHSMSQAKRVSDRTAYFHLGDLVELNTTENVFNNPEHKLTRDYISGRFG